MAIAWTSFALAADYEVSNAGGDSDLTVSTGGVAYSDGDWSGRWIDNEWTPGYWSGGSWHQATWSPDTADWTVSVDGSDIVLTGTDWDEMPRAASSSGLSEVDAARQAEYGAVKGYSSTREPGMYNEGEAVAGQHDDYSEGAKCGYHYSGCGCKSKCGSGCGCKSKCGNKCGSKCGGGCGSKCGSKCGGCSGHSCGSCRCPGREYDCWGVWHGDANNFAAIRDSDYDPVMGRGDRGGSFFGW